MPCGPSGSLDLSKSTLKISPCGPATPDAKQRPCGRPEYSTFHHRMAKPFLKIKSSKCYDAKHLRLHGEVPLVKSRLPS